MITQDPLRSIALFIVAGLLGIGGGYSCGSGSWRVDEPPPDTPEVVGALVCLVGVAIIMYFPRS